jgi:ABC-type dipeptide/oligopeptide/nickel transport system permease component
VARTIAGRQATERRSRWCARASVDQPIHVQYGRRPLRLLHGDLAIRSSTRSPCSTSSAAIFRSPLRWRWERRCSGSIGVAAGTLAATPRTLADRITTGTSLFFYSMPTFCWGSFLLVLSISSPYAAPAFPPAGTSLSQNALEWARHLLLPGSRCRW